MPVPEAKHRAAYIVTWISVAESLRNRFVTMARRDSEIGKIVRKINELEQNDKPTDKLLIEKAKDLGILESDEYEKLDHMRIMRNIYAHPTGTGPGDGEVYAALVIAINAVLGKPILMRHGYVKNLVNNLFEDIHFLDDVPIQVSEYAVGVARRIHPQVQPYLLVKLLERLEQTFDDPILTLFKRRGIDFASSLLNELRPKLSSEEWNTIENIQKYPLSSSMIFSIPSIWPLLPSQAKDMILGHLIEPMSEHVRGSPTMSGLRQAWNLASADLLTTRQQERLDRCAEHAPLDTLAGSGIPLTNYYQRIIQDLESHNWYKQNPACEAIINAGKEQINKLNKEYQEQLGRNVLQAADGTAGSAEKILELITEDQSVWPHYFVEGLVLEALVNETSMFRLKKVCFGRVLRITSMHPKARTIFNRVIREVSNSKPKHDFSAHQDCKDAVDVIEWSISEFGSHIHEHLIKLKETIDKVKLQTNEDEFL